MQEEKIVQLCKKGKKSAQKIVYEHFSPMMRAICARYASNFSDAEDILHEGFIKIFLQISKFTWSGKGSFSAWMRRIMINTAINFYRQNKKKGNEVEINDQMMIIEEKEDDSIIDILMNSGFSKEELIGLLQRVSETNRMVFNLYILENYRHKEIGLMLNIDERTSRIRLLRARKELQEIITSVYSKELKQKSKMYG